MKEYSRIKVRFAPSPTGFLHVGGLRTALFNFLFAKKNHGQFILRIEDTDKSREVAGAVENIQDSLKIFSLNWDEGPIFQSQRLDIYREHIEKLIAKGAAYKCYCSKERIAELKKQAEAEKRTFRYDKFCLKNQPATSPGLRPPSPGWGGEGRGRTYVVRQNVPEEGHTEFDDLVYGHIKIENRLLEDGVLIKSDGYPVYNFANVVDDHLMEITHVIRGEEFIPSTPKHVLLYQAFGWDLPSFVHLPLLLDKNRKKLSKRSGDVAVKDYLAKGYLPEAILNFVALLGWNPKTAKEIFTLTELINEFDVSKINKAGAIFDITKLDYINREWQKKLGDGRDPLFEHAFDLEKIRQKDKFNPELFKIIWPQMKERINGPSDLETKILEFDFYFNDPEYARELLFWKKDPSPEGTKSNLQKIKAYFAEAGQDALTNSEKTEKNVKAWIEESQLGVGNVLWPLRVALSGLKASPGPFEIISSFAKLHSGVEIIIKRIDTALEKLQ